jgi:hypothetical protein
VSSIDYQFDEIQGSFWAFSVIWSKRLDIEKNANTHLTTCQRLANRIQRHENYKLTHFLKMRSPFPPSPLQILSQSNIHHSPTLHHSGYQPLSEFLEFCIRSAIAYVKSNSTSSSERALAEVLKASVDECDRLFLLKLFPFN